MKGLSRRSLLSGLGLAGVTASIPSNLRALTQSPSGPSLDSNSACIFLDGSWLIHATADDIAAATVDCNLHNYRQFLYGDISSAHHLTPGAYTITASRPGSGSPVDQLSGLYDCLPYLHAIDRGRGFKQPTAQKLKLYVLNLPKPDNVYAAAMINFATSDYNSSDQGFQRPSKLATVTIFEYTQQKVLTLQKSSALPAVTVNPGQHCHFNVSLKQEFGHKRDQENHTLMISKQLAGLLARGGVQFTDFSLDPKDLPEDGQTSSGLYVTQGVSGLTCDELGIDCSDPSIRGKAVGSQGTSPLFSRRASTRRKNLLFLAKLANCAGGQLAAGTK